MDTRLHIRHTDGRLEPLTRFACRLNGSVLDSLRMALPVGAELVGPGEHLPATSYRPCDPVS